MTHAELRKLCESIASETRRHGIAPPVLVQAVLKHVPDLLDELERVYQVMGRSRWLQISKNIFLQGMGDGCWFVHSLGRSERFPTIQAALQRVRELERGT